jgi:hypothetical protein
LLIVHVASGTALHDVGKRSTPDWGGADEIFGVDASVLQKRLFAMLSGASLRRGWPKHVSPLWMRCAPSTGMSIPSRVILMSLRAKLGFWQ